jgi:predicted ATPase
VNHGLIFFDFEGTTWDWHEDRIMKLEPSEDIVRYFVRNTLQDDTDKNIAEILKLAACLSNREFNTLILSNLIGYPPEEANPLWLLELNSSSRNDCGPLSRRD